MKFQLLTLGTKRKTENKHTASTVPSSPTHTQGAERVCDKRDPLQGHVSIIGMFCIFIFLYPEAIPPPATAEKGMLLLTKEE